MTSSKKIRTFGAFFGFILLLGCAGFLHSRIYPIAKIAGPIAVNHTIYDEAQDHEGYLTKFLFTRGHKNAPIIIYLHGNGELASHVATYLEPLAARYNLVIPEYSGYGDDRKPSELALTENVREAILFAKKQYHNRNVYLAGSSLGGSLSIISAARFDEDIKGVLSVAAFTKMADMLGDKASFVDFHHDEYDAIGAINKINADLLLAHCLNDPVIPVDHFYHFLEVTGYSEETKSLNGHYFGALLFDCDSHYLAINDFSKSIEILVGR